MAIPKFNKLSDISLALKTHPRLDVYSLTQAEMQSLAAEVSALEQAKEKAEKERDEKNMELIAEAYIFIVETSDYKYDALDSDNLLIRMKRFYNKSKFKVKWETDHPEPEREAT